MGSFISKPVATLQWVLDEVTNLIETTAFVMSVTSIDVMDFTAGLPERAEAQMNTVFGEVEHFLTELSTQGELAQRCVTTKREELLKLRTERVANLLACYKSFENIVTRLQNERKALHDAAVKLKTDAENMVNSCEGDLESKFKCLSQGLKKMSKDVQAIVKKVEAHSKKEFAERQKIAVELMTCDREAVELAYKSIQNIVREIKTCIQEQKPRLAKQTSQYVENTEHTE